MLMKYVRTGCSGKHVAKGVKKTFEKGMLKETCEKDAGENVWEQDARKMFEQRMLKGPEKRVEKDSE